MVDVECLKNHVAQYKISKDTAGEFHKQLFTKHKDIAAYYNAEHIEPDSIAKSHKFIMYGMQILQSFFTMPQVFGDDRKWRSTLSDFKDHYEEFNIPLSEFIKTKDALIAAMEQHAGGVSDEQRTNWNALIDQAYSDMKEWGWY
ncbi:unnamed protein product [Thelazia callipaeda]|uniref:GLOBIN domain-containing protein n=1 Tax=Thelazia callipaeda TaxID=103827 RepID=A0A0N5D888_THECL|nr:unnamed protein product [Thelazia callipaeda]